MDVVLLPGPAGKVLVYEWAHIQTIGLVVDLMEAEAASVGAFVRAPHTVVTMRCHGLIRRSFVTLLKNRRSSSDKEVFVAFNYFPYSSD